MQWNHTCLGISPIAGSENLTACDNMQQMFRSCSTNKRITKVYNLSRSTIHLFSVIRHKVSDDLSENRNVYWYKRHGVHSDNNNFLSFRSHLLFSTGPTRFHRNTDDLVPRKVDKEQGIRPRSLFNRHRLSQIPRTVDVATTQNCNMEGQQLHGNNGENSL